MQCTTWKFEISFSNCAWVKREIVGYKVTVVILRNKNQKVKSTVVKYLVRK